MYFLEIYYINKLFEQKKGLSNDKPFFIAHFLPSTYFQPTIILMRHYLYLHYGKFTNQLAINYNASALYHTHAHATGSSAFA